MKKFLAICVLAALMSAGAADAAETLEFDELPYQSVNGLSYNGVTFGFGVSGSPSTDAYYNAIGPGILTYVQDSSLEGNAQGILTLDFANPTHLLEFGLALDTQKPVAGAYTVELFDNTLASLGTITANTDPLIFWSEGMFSYSGTAVSRAVIGFNDQYARRFAIDNLTTNTIPAPGAILLGSLGAGCVGWLRRRRTL
jgi:opacity protein-like surface antigen